MKKISFLALIILSLQINAQTLTKQNVSQLISYSNALVAYYNHHVEYINDLEGYIHETEENYKNGNVLNMYNPDDMHANPDYENGANPFKYSTLLLPAEKATITTHLTQWETNFKEFQVLYRKLYDYEQASTYEKDGGSEGLKLSGKLNELVDKMEPDMIAISNVLTDLGNRTFAISVKGQPLEKYYIAMHNDLSLLQNLLKEIKMYNPKYDDADLADAVIQKLKVSYNNSLDLPKAPLEKYNVASDYDNFYQGIKHFVDYYDENINYLTKTKTMSQDEFVKELIDQYNYIIERYNTFGD